MKLSIAIVNWNTRDYLRQCLSSVFNNLGGLDAEVIVVDNASSDDSVEMVKQEFPQVKLIAARENLGFAKANNAAYYLSQGDYFLLLNSDTVIIDGALGKLVRFMDSYPTAGAVGPRLLNEDGTLQRSCSPFPTVITELFDALYLSKLFPKSRIFGKFTMSYWDFDSIREVDFVGGSCLLLKRTALEQVGLLDEGYFMYTEEADLCYRLKSSRWKVFFYPEAEIVHYGGRSARLDVNRTSLDLCRSKYRFMRKHYGWTSATAYRGVVLLSSLLRLIAWAAKSATGRNSSIYWEKLTIQKKLLSWSVMVK